MEDYLHGAITTARLRSGGVGTRGIAKRVERGQLVQVQRRVYVHPAAEPSDQQIAGIALLANKGRGLITGATALGWFGLQAPRRSIVDLVVPEGLAVVHVEGAAFRRSSHIHRLQAEERHGLPIAPLWWAVGDYARDVLDHDVARVIAAGVGQRLWTVKDVKNSLDGRSNFPGSARLRRVLITLKDDLAFSGLERKAARILRQAGYPVVLNHPIVVDGEVVRAADLALPDKMIDLEIDGPHHWLPDQAAQDRRTDRRLRELSWTIDRVDADEVKADPSMVVGVMAGLIRRGSPHPTA